MVCSQELHTSFSFLNFLEGNDIYKYGNTTTGRGALNMGICLSNVTDL